jgi:hypothetical protein
MFMTGSSLYSGSTAKAAFKRAATFEGWAGLSGIRCGYEQRAADPALAIQSDIGGNGGSAARGGSGGIGGDAGGGGIGRNNSSGAGSGSGGGNNYSSSTQSVYDHEKGCYIRVEPKPWSPPNRGVGENGGSATVVPEKLRDLNAGVKGFAPPGRGKGWFSY